MIKNYNVKEKENKKVSKRPTQFINCRKRRKQHEIIDEILKSLATSKEPMTTRELSKKVRLNTVSCRRYLEILEFSEKVSRYKRAEYWNYWKIRR